MERMSLTDFRKFILKKVPEIRDSRCIDVTSDGMSLGIFVIGAQEGMRQQIVGRCDQIEAGRVYEPRKVKTRVADDEGDSGGVDKAPEGATQEKGGDGVCGEPIPEETPV